MHLCDERAHAGFDHAGRCACLIILCSPGALSLYEDSRSGGTLADYGTNPPSAVAPSSFTDGALYLQGPLTGFQFILNTTNGTGSFEGHFEITAGSQIGNFPTNQRDGWTFAGATGNALNVPEGYDHQIDGQTFLDPPVPARIVTWGRLKALYRQRHSIVPGPARRQP